MNSKLLAGSVLSAASLLAAVVDAWARHFFFALYHIARAESLEGTGSFSPGPYGLREGTAQMFLGTRILLVVLVLAGLALLAWGVLDEWRTAR